MTAPAQVKKCNSCGEYKDRSEYPPGRKMKCSECHVSRVCIRCEQRLPIERFPLSGGTKNKGLNNRFRRCHDCVNADRRKQYEQMGKDKRLKWQYGITPEERDAIFEAQGCKCAICATTESGGQGWCIDHDHACCPKKSRSCGGCIRGILCFSCNVMLGCAKDELDTLRNAIEYLQANVSRRQPIAG